MKNLLKRLEEQSKSALFNFKSDWEKTLKNALGGYNGYTSFFDETNKLRRTKGYFSELLYNRKMISKAADKFLEISNGLYNLEKKYKG